jgi:hypothetical protein
MEERIDFLVEWAVWGHLSSTKDLELILLKGHLLIENVLELVLQRNDILKFENYSFYRKINEFEKIDFLENSKKIIIIRSLRELNKLRNQLAHELHYKIENGDLSSWSFDILKNFKGTKYSKFTHRTKVVHAFSMLAINMLELNNIITKAQK